MKYIKSEKLSKQKYLLTLEVTEFDMKMLEDLTTTYAPFELYDKHREEIDFDLSPCEFNDKFRKWTMKMWRVFWMLWKEHDLDVLKIKKEKKE